MKKWFYIFNTAEFDALGVSSKSLDLVFDLLGIQTVLITKGYYYSITYNNVMLSLNVHNRNPFEFETYSIYMDASNNVYLGLPV